MYETSAMSVTKKYQGVNPAVSCHPSVLDRILSHDCSILDYKSLVNTFLLGHSAIVFNNCSF